MNAKSERLRAQLRAESAEHAHARFVRFMTELQKTECPFPGRQWLELPPEWSEPHDDV